jgi:taurine dioxygenase
VLIVATNGLEVRRLSGSIGAEVLGVDLAAEPGNNVIAEIRRIWLDHGVIFFRDQDLPPAKFLAFARQFGVAVEYPFVKGIEGFPEIIPVVKLEHETKNFGGIWHSDTAYLDVPPMATMLVAREVPPYGGDTLFASGTHAYETLSDGMKRMLDGLIAVNTSAKADVTRTREDRVRDNAKAEAKKEFVIRWCARIRRPGANRFTSMSGTRCASRT